MPFDLGKIGQLLKAARIEKGLTFEDVQHALFIRKLTIAAIESGDWQRLPPETYVRGYITQYASLLHVLDLVKPELTPNEPTAAAQKEPRETLAPRKEVSLQPRALGKRIVGIGVTAGIMVAFLVFLNVQRPGRVAQPPYQTRQHSQQATAMPVAPTDQATQPEDRAQEKPPEGNVVENNYQTVAGANQSENAYDRHEEKVVLDPKKLMIACQERTWLMVVIDGSERKEFTLNREEVLMLSAKESFDVLIGNAAGVKLFYNGKDIDFTGERGQVKRIKLS